MKSSHLTLIAAATSVILAIPLSGLPARAADRRCDSRRATIVGTDGADDLTGTRRDDVIVALGGDDLIEGLGGDDVVCSGDGFDFVTGGKGNDRLLGGPGDETLKGGAGHDSLHGNGGSDFMTGGTGDDALRAGPSGEPFFDDLMGGPGDDILDGGSGLDRVLFFDSKQGVEVDLGVGTAIGDGDDDLTSIEGAVGSNFDDMLVGTDVGNGLSGGAGDDTLRGLGSGTFESGSDLLFPGAGEDDVQGGGGFDFISFDGGCFVTVDLGAGTATGEGDDTVEDVEGAFGSDCEDTLIGDGGDNAFVGGPGDDTIDGAGGEDTAIYLFTLGPVVANLETGIARGEDRLGRPGPGADGLADIENLWGSSLGDLLVGDGEDNDLLGLWGRDSITGGAGDDLLDGGDGNDRLDGSLGFDTCFGEFTLGCESEGAAAGAREERRINPWVDLGAVAAPRS